MRLIIVNDRSFFEPDGGDDTRGVVAPHGLDTALTREDFPDKLFMSSARGPAQRAMAARGVVDFHAGDRRFRVRLVASPEAAYRAFYDVEVHHPAGRQGPLGRSASRAHEQLVREVVARQRGVQAVRSDHAAGIVAAVRLEEAPVVDDDQPHGSPSRWPVRYPIRAE